MFVIPHLAFASLLATLAVFAVPVGKAHGQTGTLAFSTDPRGGSADVFTAGADGSSLVNFTGGLPKVRGEGDPQFFPDGQRLLFTAKTGGSDPTSHVFIVDLNHGASTDLTPGNRDSYEPDVSPDGTKIAYWSTDGISWMNADGSANAQLVQGRAPAFSPSGTTLAFVDGGIKLLDLTSGFVATVAADTSSESYDDPEFSPDGEQLTFTGFNGDYDVFTIGVGGSGLTNVTDSPTDEFGPVFSPDGLAIAYGRSAGQPQLSYEIVARATNGSERVIMQVKSEADSSLDWHPRTPPAGFRQLVDGEQYQRLVSFVRQLGRLKGRAVTRDDKNRYYNRLYACFTAAVDEARELPTSSDPEALARDIERLRKLRDRARKRIRHLPVKSN